jgi:hypothetical protein
MEYLVDTRRIWQVAGAIFVASGWLFAGTASARLKTDILTAVSFPVHGLPHPQTTTHVAGAQSWTGQDIGWPQPRFDAARTAYNSLEKKPQCWKRRPSPVDVA